MVDKLRRTHPLNITFAEGEEPTGAKLTAIASQARVGARVLEKAVGDLWNQSGDAILTDWPLQIPNLARQVGENKWMNPVIYPVHQQFTYRDNVGSKYSHQNHGFLQFAPYSLASISAVSGSTHLTNRVTSEYLVVSAGDYWVDLTTGKFTTFSALDSSDKLDYTVDSSSWSITNGTVPGVVPDPRQAEFTGCRISTDGSNYFLHLPPRRPLSLTGFDLPERYPSSTDLTDNQATSITPYKFWQSASTTALADAHYRYAFPKELDDIISSLGEGASIPEGFIYLWNQGTGTIVEDATFTKSSLGNWILKITAPSQDLASKVSSDESQTSYNMTNYSLIMVGSPIARSIYSLSKAIYSNAHSNKGDFTPILNHSNLAGLNPPDSGYSDHSSRYPSSVPVWSPSRWSMDDHVSLLSRAGSQGTSGGRHRDVNDNAMLGDLLLGSSVSSGGNYLNTTYISNKIRFGTASGAYLYGKAGGSLVSAGTAFGVGTVQAPTNIVMTGDNYIFGGAGNAGTINVYVVPVDLNGKFGSISAKATQTFTGWEEWHVTWSEPVGGSTYNVYVNLTGQGNDTGWVAYTGQAGGSTVTDLFFGWSLFPSITEAALLALYPANKDASSVIYLDSSNTNTYLGGTTLISGYGANLKFYGNATLSGNGSGSISVTPSGNKPPFILLNQSIEPSTATAGSLYVNTGKLRVGNGTVFDRVVSNSQTNTAVSTAITSASETEFDQTYVIPANTLVAGSSIRVRAHGVTTTNGSSVNLTIRLKFGTGAIGSRTVMATVLAGAPSASQVWVVDAWIVVRTIGSSGTAVCGGSGSVTSAGWTPIGTTAAVSINTPQNNTVSISGQWATTTGSPSVRLDSIMVDVQ